jgi:hypothetical protein
VDTSEIPMLNLHPQPSWREDAHIVANRAGLELLKTQIEEVLAVDSGRSRIEHEFTSSDGEEYALEILRVDEPYEDSTWLRAAVPYTEKSARESRPDAITPSERAEMHARPRAPRS